MSFINAPIYNLHYFGDVIVAHNARGLSESVKCWYHEEVQAEKRKPECLVSVMCNFPLTGITTWNMLWQKQQPEYQF